jgi:hypothetical protein
MIGDGDSLVEELCQVIWATGIICGFFALSPPRFVAVSGICTCGRVNTHEIVP